MLDKPPKPLDYMTPAPASPARGTRKTAGGCIGILLGVFGLPFLIRGAVCISHITRGTNRFWRSDDAGAGIPSFLLGLFCVGMAARWLSKSFRNRSGG